MRGRVSASSMAVVLAACEPAAAEDVEVVVMPAVPVEPDESTRAPAPEPTPVPTPAPKGPCPDGMTLVPGGTWTPAQRRYLDRWNRLSQQWVEIVFADRVEDFCLDLHEVTIGRFASCMEDGRCNAPELAGLRRWVKSDEVDALLLTRPLPMAHDDAAPVCRALGHRLPTIEEWLWAYWGGQEHRRYPWGASRLEHTRENLCDRACRDQLEPCVTKTCERRRKWMGDDPYPGSAPVGSFPDGAGRWGHLDLLGNVTEEVTVTTRRGAAEEFQVKCGARWIFDLRMMTSLGRERYFPCLQGTALPVIASNDLGWGSFELTADGARCAAAPIAAL